MKKIFYKLHLKESRFGIMFCPTGGIEFYLGWVGFSVVWNFSVISGGGLEILNSLPSFPPLHWPCKKCGALDEGQGCNMDGEFNVTNCEKCSEVTIK